MEQKEAEKLKKEEGGVVDEELDQAFSRDVNNLASLERSATLKRIEADQKETAEGKTDLQVLHRMSEAFSNLQEIQEQQANEPTKQKKE